MRLTHLEIKGFRSLYDVSIEMRPLMVLIGPNGAGKTAFLDVFRLLQRGARLQLADAVSEQGGMEGIRSLRLQPNADLEMSLVLDESEVGSDNHHEFYYKCTLHGRHHAEIVLESLTWLERLESDRVKKAHAAIFDADEFMAYYYSDDYGKLPLNRRDDELGIAQAAPVQSACAIVTDFFAKAAYYSVLDVSPNLPIRLPQDLSPGFDPLNNGSRLFSALHNIRAQHHEYFERINEYLRIAFPEFERLDFPIVATGKAAMLWYEKDQQQPFDQTFLSEGTLRFLWLLTVLYNPQKPPLILIDEPEVSLHPHLLMLLSNAIKEASQSTQVIIATHSDRLIRRFDPEQVAVVEKEDGKTKINWLPAERLKSWLEDYSLDELWEMGELGGRPV